MKKQFGNALTAVLVTVGIIFTIAVAAIMMAISANNYAVKAEAGIKAAWEDNQNVLGQYGLKVQEVAQVPDMYKDGLKEVVQAEMSGRYGKEGSQATMQWLKERNLTFDSSLYAKIQQVMEAGRNEFQTKQTVLLDKKRIYEAELGTFPRGFILGMMGFPKTPLDKFNIVITERAEQAFKTGKDTAIQIRPNTPLAK